MGRYIYWLLFDTSKVVYDAPHRGLHSDLSLVAVGSFLVVDLVRPFFHCGVVQDEALARTRFLSTGRVKARAARSLRSHPPRTSSSPPRAPPIAAAASQSRRPLLLHNPLQRLLLQSSRSSSPNLLPMAAGHQPRKLLL
jgi:hypothetical protein